MALGLRLRSVECANDGTALARLRFEALSVENRYDAPARREDPACLKDSESRRNARSPNAQHLRKLFVREQQFVL